MSGFLGMMPIAALMGGYRINASGLFDGSGDYLSRTPGSTSGNSQFWVSAWVKLGNVGVHQEICSAYGGGTGLYIRLLSTGEVQIQNYAGTVYRKSTSLYRDPSGWGHLLLSFNGSTSIDGYWNGSAIVWATSSALPASYDWHSNVLHRIACPAHAVSDLWPGYLAEFASGSGAVGSVSDFGTADATTGEWKPKAISGLTYGANGFYLPAPSTGLDASGNVVLGTFDPSRKGSFWTLSGSDLTAATSGSGVSGVFITRSAMHRKTYWRILIDAASSTAGWAWLGLAKPTDRDSDIADADTCQISLAGAVWANGSNLGSFGGAFSIGSYVDLAFDPETGKFWVGENGTWRNSGDPAAGTGHVATLPAGDWIPRILHSSGSSYSGTFTLDQGLSGAPSGFEGLAGGNDWTVNGSPVQVSDTPTHNYCTLNPLDAGTGLTYATGNLRVYTASADSGVRATMAVDTGKWVWEATIATAPGTAHGLGIASGTAPLTAATRASFVDAIVYWNDGNKNVDGTLSAYGGATVGKVVRVELDADAASVEFFLDGASQGAVAIPAGVPSPWFPVWKTTGNADDATFNFGATAFAGTPTTGFLPLSTANLPAATIPDGDAHFQAVLDTGATIKATAEGVFAGSDYLVWIKDRDNANNHQLIDTVRGTGAVLQSNSAGAETTYSAPSGNSVAWCWKKGAASGFDILTAAHVNGVSEVVPHSLGDKPQMILMKNRSVGSTSWLVWHTGLTSENHWLYLEGTSGQLDWGSNVFNPAAATISIPSAHDTGDVVIYVFAEIEGFNRFGSYTGNGSADGPFVHCGFKPAFVMVKRTDSANDWIVCDAARAPENPVGLSNGGVFYPNLSNAEGTGGAVMDINANGFKLRETYARLNASGGTYIYIAFADAPFGGGKRRAPATAR